jgi:hypothetical protein
MHEKIKKMEMSNMFKPPFNFLNQTPFDFLNQTPFDFLNQTPLIF